MNFKRSKAHANFLFYIFASVLLIIGFALQMLSVRFESQTNDEAVHMLSGVTALKAGSYIFNREHPPLMKLFAGLPLFLADVDIKRDHPAWKTAGEWELAPEFLYNNNLPVDYLLFLARLPTMLFSIVLGWVIFLWSKKLFGAWAGLFSLALYVFDPNMIAHSRYVTTDLGVTLFITLGLFTLTRYFQKPNTKHLVFASGAFALAQVSKFSAVILAPIYVFFFLFHTFISFREAKQSQISVKHLSQFFFACLIMMFLVITFVYALALPHWRENMVPLPYVKSDVFQLPFYHLYLDGLTYVVAHSVQGHPAAYLLGQYAAFKSWWYYFPLTFLFKTPFPTLVIFLFLGLYLFVRALQNLQYPLRSALQRIPFDYFILFFTPLLYMFASMVNKINIGWRHIMPIYPFLFVLSGALLIPLRHLPRLARRAWAGVLFFFLALLIATSIRAYPFYLAYFSDIVGGSARGYKYLIDSNLDWGQDLRRLKMYMDATDIPWVYLHYYGGAEHTAYAIDAKEVPTFANAEVIQRLNGVVAISITSLLTPSGEFHWLYSYKPLDIIGYTIYLYDFRK